MKTTAQIDTKMVSNKKNIKKIETHNQPGESFSSSEMPEGSISLDSAIDLIWSKLETKIGYDLRTSQK